MSYAWAFFGADKNKVFIGSIFLGWCVCLLSGVPILLILRENKYYLPVWVGIIFVLIVFPISTYWFYKAGCNKLKKK